jgi:peptide/nickel transport system substrate-binding protein
MVIVGAGVATAQDEVVFVLAFEQEGALADPFNSMTWMSYLNNLYNRDLWEWNSAREPFPVMAAELPTMDNGGIGFTDEGNTWIQVTLREGLMWSDGTPITSADCEATHYGLWNRDSSPNWNRGDYPDKVAGFEIIDELTFRVTYVQPLPDNINAPQAPSCQYPAHIINPTREAGEIIDSDPYWTLEEGSVGFGPFKVIDREIGAGFTLVQNEYWPEYFQQPAIDRIEVVLIPEVSQEVNAMRVGDIDLALNWTEAEIPDFQSIEGVEIFNTPGAYSDSLWIRSGPLVDVATPARDALQDLRVRQAIIHALDRQTMVDTIVAPGVNFPKSWYPPQYWPEDLTVLEYDVDRARELLDEAGWYDHDGDEGTVDFPSARQNENGDKLEGIRLGTTTNNIRNAFQLAIQAYLYEVGIRVDVTIYPASLFFATFQQDGIINAYHADLMIYASSNIALSPVSYPNSYYCDMWPTPENPDGGNNLQFCDPRFDELDTLISQTFPGPERDAMVDEAVKIFTDFAFFNGLRFRPTWWAVAADRWDINTFYETGTLGDDELSFAEYWTPLD